MKELPRSLSQKEVAQLYIKRLVDACDLLRTIDTGDYPFKEYSSGEVSGTKRVQTKDGWETQDVYASINIFPEGNKKGGRYAVARTIFVYGEDLAKMGARREVDDIINLTRARDMGSYIGNKDEDCEGK